MSEHTVRERMLHVREEAILDAAHELMAREGYAAMCMDALAAAVGISKATLYQHFPSKEEIAISVLRRVMRRSQDYLAGLDPHLPAVVRLEKVLRHIIEQRFGEGRPDLGASRPALHLLLRTHPDYQADYQAAMGSLCALVDEAKAEGCLANDPPTRLIVQVAISCVRDTEYEDLIATGQCSVSELSNTLISIIFDGVRAGCRTPQPV